MISIIIPNYNRAHYLEQSLQSVCSQTFQDWEILVVDDGSTDKSKVLVKELADHDKRIQWLERSIQPKGAATCRNLGIENAKGNYIIFLDSDDVLAPHCLEQRMGIMESYPNLDFAVFKMQFFTEKIGDNQHLWNLETEENTLNRFLKLDAVWQTSGPIWKTSALKKIGGFNPLLKCWQDIDIHFKALFANLNYKICYGMPVDCFYRKNSTESISQSNTSSLEKLESKKLLYQWILSQEQYAFTSNQMALHILLSAIHGYQFKFFNRFYYRVISSLSLSERKSVRKMYLIKRYRLYKIEYFLMLYLKLKSSLIKENHIGKFFLTYEA